MLFIIVLSTLITWYVIRHYHKSTKLPPGPISIPLIGNIHQLMYRAWRLGGIVPALDYYRKVYGNVFTIWMGPLPHVSVTDFDTNQQLFIKNGNKYVDRFLPPIFEAMSGNIGLVAANGEIWAELRRFTMLTFRNLGVGRDIMEERILAEVDARCAEIDRDAENGRTIVNTTEFFDLTVGSVINSILVGKRFEEHNKHEFLQIKRAMDAAGEYFSILDLTVPVWVLKYFFPKRYNDNFAILSKIENFVSMEALQRIEDVKNGKKVLDPDNAEDLVDAFLIKKEREDANGGHPAYTIPALQHVLSDLWLAGQDTTATTLVSGFNQLINNPEVIVNVREELMKVTDNASRPLSIKDRPNTPYLNATLAEIQRHASILNVNFWRYNHEMITVGGYPVDKGALICAQLGAIHVNDEIFENPEKFDPSRFIKNEKLLHQIIPFGIGKRSCVGENIARNELYLMTGNLIMRYDFKPHGKLPETRDFLPYSSGKMPDKTVKLEFIKL